MTALMSSDSLNHAKAGKKHKKKLALVNAPATAKEIQIVNWNGSVMSPVALM